MDASQVSLSVTESLNPSEYSEDVVPITTDEVRDKVDSIEVPLTKISDEEDEEAKELRVVNESVSIESPREETSEEGTVSQEKAVNEDATHNLRKSEDQSDQQNDRDPGNIKNEAENDLPKTSNVGPDQEVQAEAEAEDGSGNNHKHNVRTLKSFVSMRIPHRIPKHKPTLNDIISAHNLEYEAKIAKDFGFEGHQYLDSILENISLSINQFPITTLEECVLRWETIYKSFAEQWTFNFLFLNNWGIVWRGTYIDRKPNQDSLYGAALEIVNDELCWYHVYRNIKVAAGRYQLQWRFKYDCDTTEKGPRIDQNFSFNTYLYESSNSSWSIHSKKKLLSSVNLPDLDGVLDDKEGFHTVAFAEFDIPPSEIPGEWRMILVEVRETDFLFPKTVFVSSLLFNGICSIDLI